MISEDRLTTEWISVFLTTGAFDFDFPTLYGRTCFYFIISYLYEYLFETLCEPKHVEKWSQKWEIPAEAVLGFENIFEDKSL